MTEIVEISLETCGERGSLQQDGKTLNLSQTALGSPVRLQGKRKGVSVPSMCKPSSMSPCHFNPNPLVRRLELYAAFCVQRPIVPRHIILLLRVSRKKCGEVAAEAGGANFKFYLYAGIQRFYSSKKYLLNALINEKYTY
ncbi:hypothetical protein MG293_011221 [Ovis ammon polii]|uniref:Uncharacterized protein n=1 Tax=Ovis ammon polii TaxID=230172 RepID=A0AAD4U724_OVIAM|nr:hypothetical protein MG293_011221 [Ovis ammon polii]